MARKFAVRTPFIFHPAILSWISFFLSKPIIPDRVSLVLSHLFSVNAGVPQGYLPVSIIIVFLNDPVTSIFNPVHCFTVDATFHCSLSYSNAQQATNNIDHDRTVPSDSLAFYLGKSLPGTLLTASVSILPKPFYHLLRSDISLIILS